MAESRRTLKIIIGRNLPLKDCDLVFASTNADGTPGELNISVLSQLGATREVLKRASNKLKDGFALERVNNEQKLALIVTIGRQENEKTFETNLSRMLSDSIEAQQIADAISVWMPLMGVGSGGLSFGESLGITIRSIIMGYKKGSLAWQDLKLSIGSEATFSTVETLAGIAQQMLAYSSISPEIIIADQAIEEGSSSNELHPEGMRGNREIAEPKEPIRIRGFNDDLRTQIDAPAEQPKLRFSDIANAIISVVEDAVRLDEDRRESGNAQEVRQREWQSASEARLTIGIYAPWGAGKSTLVNALRSEFLNRKYPVFTVNPWKWSGKEDLHDHVRATVVDQAGKQRGVYLLLAWLRWRTFARSYRRYLWWMLFVVTAVAVFYQPVTAFLRTILASKEPLSAALDVLKQASPDWSPAIWVGVGSAVWKLFGGSLSKWIEATLFKGVPAKLGADGLSLVYRDIATLIYRGGTNFKPFVFFFDDLDRCTPERVAAVLESVHSLTAAGCVVFLACDDEFVIAALNAHYSSVAKAYGDGTIFGRRYLEKIVQIPFRLPLLKNSDVFELGLARMPRIHEVVLPDSEVGKVIATKNPNGIGLSLPPTTPITPEPEMNEAVLNAHLQEIIG